MGHYRRRGIFRYAVAMTQAAANLPNSLNRPSSSRRVISPPQCRACRRRSSCGGSGISPKRFGLWAGFAERLATAMKPLGSTQMRRPELDLRRHKRRLDDGWVHGAGNRRPSSSAAVN
jgi:hypothetical protein